MRRQVGASLAWLGIPLWCTNSNHWRTHVDQAVLEQLLGPAAAFSQGWPPNSRPAPSTSSISTRSSSRPQPMRPTSMASLLAWTSRSQRTEELREPQERLLDPVLVFEPDNTSEV